MFIVLAALLVVCSFGSDKAGGVSQVPSDSDTFKQISSTYVENSDSIVYEEIVDEMGDEYPNESLDNINLTLESLTYQVVAGAKYVLEIGIDINGDNNDDYLAWVTLVVVPWENEEEVTDITIIPAESDVRIHIDTN